MKASILNIFTVSIGLSTVGILAAEDAPKLPPTPLQLLADKNADRKADLTLSDLKDLFENHKSELFSDKPDDLRKFGLLREWCDSLRQQPDAVELQPLILAEIVARKAVDRKPEGWDEIAILGHGGDVGLLMGCVVDISKEQGVEKILDLIVRAEDPAKLKILLKQLDILQLRAKYDPIVDARLKSLGSQSLTAAAESYRKETAEQK